MTSFSTPESAKSTQDRATTTEKKQLDKELIRAKLAALQNTHADAQARHAANMAAIGNNETYGQKNSEASKFGAKDFEGKKFEGKKSDAKSFDNISIGRENRADYLEKLAKAKARAENRLEGEDAKQDAKQDAKKEVQRAAVSTNLMPTTTRGEDHWGFPIPDSDSEDDEEDDDDSDDFDDEIRYGQATGSGWL